jgi:glycosyltransferase involved in cell wall biosynthesis
LIIVDDASTDGTESLVKEYDDGRIRYVRRDLNGGAPAARNTGIRLARGEFLAFLDSDNEWLPERLQKQVELFSRVDDSIGVIYANNKVIDEVKGEEQEWAFGLRGNLYAEFLQRPFMDFITPLIRKACFDKIGLMDENVPSYQEWDTFLRISRYFEFDFVPEVLAVYYYHKGNAYSQDPVRIVNGYRYVFEKHKDEMLSSLSRRVLIEHHRNLARWYRSAHAYGSMLKNQLLSWYYNIFA